MPEEVKDTAATGKGVADADLDKAWDEEFGEKKEEIKKEEKVETKVETKKEEIKEEIKEVKEELKDEDLSQAERSRLGRKLKRLEEQQTQFMSDVTSKLDRLLNERGNREEAITEEKPPKYISTAEDLERYEEERETKIERAHQEYGKAYLNSMFKLLEEDKDIPEDAKTEIEDLLTKPGSPFNVKRGNARRPATWNPAYDVELNYAKAKASLLVKKVAKRVVPGKHEKAEGTALSISTKVDKSEAPEVELDDFAKDFVQRTGMSQDSVKSALKGEAGPHLTRR